MDRTQWQEICIIRNCKNPRMDGQFICSEHVLRCMAKTGHPPVSLNWTSHSIDHRVIFSNWIAWERDQRGEQQTPVRLRPV